MPCTLINSLLVGSQVVLRQLQASTADVQCSCPSQSSQQVGLESDLDRVEAVAAIRQDNFRVDAAVHKGADFAVQHRGCIEERLGIRRINLFEDYR